jgi:gliding motility-associated-like protein
MTYILTVTETGEGYQCAAKDTVTVRINCDDFNVPNAFVPTSVNGGSNKFGILNRSLIKLNFFRVYNRYGQLVFETTDITQKWDGLFNGSLATEGVYVWQADGFCANGKRIFKQGNVTLLR